MSLQKTSNASWVFWAIPPLVAIVAMALFVITKAYFAELSTAASCASTFTPQIGDHPFIWRTLSYLGSR